MLYIILRRNTQRNECKNTLNRNRYRTNKHNYVRNRSIFLRCQVAQTKIFNTIDVTTHTSYIHD